jgi:hypothetical protein
MSSHLRHCPKHRKPLPCAHCAVATPIIQLITVPGFISTTLPHEYKRYKDVWVCIHCNHNDHADTPSTDVCSKRNIAIVNQTSAWKQFDKKIAERERRAKAARERRQKNADQLAAIKESLRIPAAVRIAAAREKQRQERSEPKVPQGIVFSNHYRSSGREVSGGDYVTEIQEAIDGKRAQDFGGKRVTPQGIGHRFGMSNTPDEESTRDPWTKNSEEVAVAKPQTPIIDGDIFKVKLADADWTKSPAYECIPHYFVEMLPLHYQIRCTKCGAAQDDSETVAEDCFVCRNCGASHDGEEMNYVCRLCGDLSEGKKGAAHHMTNAHGNEGLEGHVQSFGNVLQRWLRGGKKPPNIEKAIRKAGKQVTA